MEIRRLREEGYEKKGTRAELSSKDLADLGMRGCKVILDPFCVKSHIGHE